MTEISKQEPLIKLLILILLFLFMFIISFKDFSLKLLNMYFLFTN